MISAGKVLSKTAIEEYLDGGYTKEAIEYQVRNGKGPMPAWEGVLSEDEIVAVARVPFVCKNFLFSVKVFFFLGSLVGWCQCEIPKKQLQTLLYAAKFFVYSCSHVCARWLDWHWSIFFLPKFD